MYFAEKGKGSYLNGKKLRVSKKNKLRDCVLAFSLPNEIKLSRKTLAILNKNYGTFRAVRNFGSAALNLCYVAEEKFDLYFSLEIKSWDIAAAKLIVEEAQGKITNLDGKRWKLRDKNFAASNEIMHSKFMKLLK
jgi:myo-inositol-1(or 4)-monophosphatase